LPTTNGQNLKAMRIFIALNIDDSIRERIQRFLEGVRGFAPDARWVRPESLHVTLKFIGERPGQAVEEIRKAIGPIKSGPIDLCFRGSGFFPTVKSARVFWIGVESGAELGHLAATVDEATARLGIPREEHTFSPHLTLARAGKSGAPQRQKGDSPNAVFKRLQGKLAGMPQPEFGTMTAREFYLYESKLSPGGAQYTKL
jgi:RNA 2',3'-cyclic 3'-phosphodiesterase